MVAYAYLRVSTDHQDLDNQRHGILEYANHHDISSLQFVEDTASGNLKWRSRAIGTLLLETAQSEDIVVTSPITLPQWQAYISFFSLTSGGHRPKLHFLPTSRLEGGKL